MRTMPAANHIEDSQLCPSCVLYREAPLYYHKLYLSYDPQMLTNHSWVVTYRLLLTLMYVCIYI